MKTSSWDIRAEAIVRMLKSCGIDAVLLPGRRVSVPAEEAIKGWDDMSKEITASAIHTERFLMNVKKVAKVMRRVKRFKKEQGIT